MFRNRIRSHDRRGFTLVELIVALLVTEVALLALVGSATTLTREIAIAALRSRAQAAAAARLEQLASSSCAGAAARDSVWATNLRESWTVTPGARGTAEVSDSVTFTTSDAALHTLVLRTRVRC